MFDSITLQANRYKDLDAKEVVGLQPPENIENKWDTLGHGTLSALSSGKINPILIHYAEMGEALRKDDVAAFNAAVAAQQKEFALPAVTSKVHFETFLHQVAPFYRGAILLMYWRLCAHASAGWHGARICAARRWG